MKMMRKLAAILLAAMLLTGLCAVATAEGRYVRANGEVNVRTGPGAQYGSLGSLRKGEQVEYLGYTSTDSAGGTWYEVQYYSYGVGWVSTGHVEIVYGGGAGVEDSDVPLYGDYVEATDGQSNLRVGPGLDYDPVSVMKVGDIAVYLNNWSMDERGVYWYYVNFDGVVGWVSSRYTTLDYGYPQSASGGSSNYSGPLDFDMDDTFVAGSRVRATASVNVRTGPGLDYYDMGTLKKDDQVEYLGYSSMDDRGVVWYQVRYYSFGIGWVSSRYSEVLYDWSEGVNGVDGYVYGSTVEGTRGQSNLRTGPGLDYDDIGTLRKGETADYLGQWSVDDRGVTWYYVNLDGDVGWVSARYTTLY